MRRMHCISRMKGWPRTQQAHDCAFRFRYIAAARGGYPVSLFGSGEKRQALSAPSSDKPSLEAGLSVLILKIPNNPILQSCRRPDCNCGATLVRTRPCVHVIEPHCSRFVFHRICIKARPMETPLCKISFLILTPGTSKTVCALHFRPLEPAIPSVQQRPAGRMIAALRFSRPPPAEV